jgi:hypothetical protein
MEGEGVWRMGIRGERFFGRGSRDVVRHRLPTYRWCRFQGAGFPQALCRAIKHSKHSLYRTNAGELPRPRVSSLHAPAASCCVKSCLDPYARSSAASRPASRFKRAGASASASGSWKQWTNPSAHVPGPTPDRQARRLHLRRSLKDARVYEAAHSMLPFVRHPRNPHPTPSPYLTKTQTAPPPPLPTATTPHLSV